MGRFGGGVEGVFVFTWHGGLLFCVVGKAFVLFVLGGRWKVVGKKERNWFEEVVIST